MTVTDLYTSLPADLRGNALEAHSGWPRTWTTPDHERGMHVRTALTSIIALSGIPFDVDVTSTDTGVTITVNRKFTP